MQNIWRKKRKNYVFGGLEKLNFTYIAFKLAKSNLGQLFAYNLKVLLL